MLTISLKAQKGTLDVKESSLKTYIYGVAKNKYKEFKRANSQYLHVEDGTLDHIPEADLDTSNETEVALVRKCLTELGEPCKSVLELYYFHGMSMEEIRKHLVYKNSQTTKNMKYKCLLRLREKFQRELGKITSNS